MIAFILYVVMWVFSIVMVITDEQNRVEWIILTWVLIVGMRNEVKE